MVRISTIKFMIGLVLSIGGILLTLLNGIICNFLCGGSCIQQQNESCVFLFLFVAIILIVCGYILIIKK